MAKFIAKRIFMMIPVLIGVMLVVFSMLYFTPGDAADFLLGENATPVEKQILREKLKLDQPYLVQFGNYVQRIVFHGDMGTSYATKRPVTDELLDRFSVTLKLSLLCIVFATAVGVTTGVISATKQ